MLLILIAIIVIAIFRIVNTYFLSVGSLRGIMQQMSVTGVMAVGVTCLFIGGGIDLSGTNVCFFAGIIAALLINAGVHWLLAAVIVVVIGALLGSINAFMIARLGMMPFIATIALSNVLYGVNLAITKGQNIPIPHKEFWWGGVSLFNAIPIPFIILIVLLVLYGFMLSKSQFGRNIYLVGGNQAAARLTGVNPVKTRSILYINNGALSALAGVVLTSRMQTATPQSQSDSQMTAITAAILGGVAFTGGVGGMPGCFIGIVILCFFNSGLISLALDSFWQLIASGVLLIIALTVDFFNERSRELSLKGRNISALRAKKEGGQ
jgi:ribose transport system permease protein